MFVKEAAVLEIVAISRKNIIVNCLFLVSASFASKEKKLLLDLNDSKEVVVAVYLLKDKRRREWVDVVGGGFFVGWPMYFSL